MTTATAALLRSSVPGRAHATTAVRWSHGAAARAIIRKAINQRTRLLRDGSSGLTAGDVRPAIARMLVFLNTTNDHMSEATLHRFAAEHMHDLRLVMPSTAGGASLLEDFTNLLSR